MIVRCLLYHPSWLRTALNVIKLMIRAPLSAAICPVLKIHHLFQVRILRVVIILTLSSQHPNSLAKVSAAATETAAPNIHNPYSHSSVRNAPVAISAGIPPLASTLIQPR